MIGPLELVHFQSERFKSKLFESLGIVKRALDGARKPYIAFSGGKDSVALTGLVHAIAPDVELHWSDDELEYPEVVQYMELLQRAAGKQLTITLGLAEHNHWFFPWVEKPYWRHWLPGTKRINKDVDYWRSLRGYDLTFTGLRMNENSKRRSWLLQAGAIYQVNSGTGTRCCPLMHWTEDDVWALIAGWKLAYCAVYDRLDEIGVLRKQQRVGPLPLARREHLALGWPALLVDLESRYGERWD